MITLKKRRFINPHMYDGGGFAGLGNIISDTVMPGFISAIQEYNAPVSDNAKKLGDEYVRLRESYNRNPLGIMGFRMANNINSDLNRIEDETANVLKGLNTSYSTRSMDDALNNYNNLLGKKNYYDNYDFNMPKNFNRFMKSTLTGTSIGTQIAPGWGTLIGTAAGAAEYLLNSPFNNKILDSADVFGRKAIRNKYNLALASSLNNINNINMWSNINKSTNYGAYGGPINVGLLPVNGTIDYMQNNDIIDSMNNSKQNTKYNFPSFAFGGSLMSNGGDWNNGLTYVDNGGTHEENPMGGVMMGVAQDGNPNYVEEGEYVWTNDDEEKYVFSDRLKLPKEFYPLFGIKKSKKEITFADVAQKIDDESSERPNDPIENRGKNDSLYKLMQIQEEERNIEQQQQQLAAQQEQLAQAAYALGGGLNRKKDYGSKKHPYPKVKSKDFAGGGRSYPIPTKADAIDALRLAGLHGRPDVKTKVYKKYPELKHALGGHLFPVGGDMIEFDPSFWNWIPIDNILQRYPQFVDVSNIKIKEPPQIKLPIKRNPYFKLKIDGVDENGNIDFKKIKDKAIVTANNEPLLTYDQWKEKWDKDKDSERQAFIDGLKTSGPETKLMNWPVYASGLAFMHNLFNKPDYEYPDEFKRTSDLALSKIPYAKEEKLGHFYLPLRLFDRFNLANELSSNLIATDRNVINMSGGDYGKMINGLLATNYNNNIDFGKLYRQGEEFNAKQRLEKAKFDKDIDQYNSTANLQAQKANIDRGIKVADKAIEDEYKYLALKQAIDSEYANNLGTSLGEFASHAGELGKYYQNLYTTNALIKSGVFELLNKYMQDAYTQHGACGGRLRTKKRKKGLTI